jgi:N-acyl-D-aspartate/D-glutamate deacylase
MIDGRCLSKVTQGVTTEIMGEGTTPAPFGGRIENPTLGFPIYTDRLPEWVERARTWKRFGDWFAALMDHGVSPNVGSFVGGGTLREYAKGLQMGRPTAEELEVMRRAAAEAMEDGALGVSYALIYPPDAYTEIDELVEVCRVIGRYGGIYVTHIRSEADEIFSAVHEALEIGRRAGLPVEIYHLKAMGRRNWDKMPQVIELIDQARAGGVDVTADMYPYVAGAAGLASTLPPWAAADGKLLENLSDPDTRAKIKAAALNPDGSWEAMRDQAGIDGVVPCGFRKQENMAYVGKRLSEIANMRGSDWVDTVFDLLLSEEQRIFTIYYFMTEANIRLKLKHPWMKISTDAGGYDPVWREPMGPAHPRAYGTYPRVLGKYVRDEQIIPLEDAVRKMTSAVADRLGIRERGQLRRGMQADVVLFDDAAIKDRAAFEEPHQLSVGVQDVWINGTRVVRGGKHTGATTGRVVRGPGA